MSRTAGIRGWLPARADAAVAAGLTAFALLTLPFVEQLSPVDTSVDAGAVVLVVLAGAATAFRNRWPVHTLAVVALTVSGYLVLGYPYGPVMFLVAVAVYSAARALPLVPAVVCGAVTLAVLIVHLLTHQAALPGPAGLVPAAAWVAIPLTLGAARRLVVEAGVRERAEADRRLVDAERLRLAHEVHDVVGHGLAAIQMQADIALHVRDRRPGQTDLALEAISRASAEALTELRTTLAAITPASSAPTPGLARLDALRARVEEAGVEVDLRLEGLPRPLPSAVDLAAYRILQESLTNVVKHSAHPRAEVVVAYGADQLVLTVANQHLDAVPHADGFGLTGMRRRAEQLGGRLTAGPGGGSAGFEVRAVLPAAAGHEGTR